MTAPPAAPSAGPPTRPPAGPAGPPSGHRGTVVVLVVSLVALAVLVALSAVFTYRTVIQLWLGASAFVVFVPAVLALRRLDRAGALPRAGRLLFGVAVVLNLLAVTNSPSTSDDDWRYLWDGRVQLHGVDPYRYPPSSSALADLRTPALFPDSGECHFHQFDEDGSPPDTDDGCTRMNRPTVRTIYPPVAQAFFTAMSAVTFGGHGNEFSMQVAAGLGVLLIGWLLWRRGRARGDPAWWVALWLWCPTVVLEATQNAHIDWLGVLVVVVAVAVVPARCAVLRGLLLGAAAGVKLYPAVVGASMLRRRPVALVVSAVALFLGSYVPHVLAVGTGVLGYLPDYLQQEDYSSGSRFLLVSLVFSGQAASVVAVGIVGVTLLWAVVRGDPEEPARTAVVTFGVAMLVATPNQAWYTLLLVALAVLARRPEWLLVGPVMAVFYLVQGHVPDANVVGRWGFVLVLFAVVGAAAWRHSRGTADDGFSATPPSTRPVPVVPSAA